MSKVVAHNRAINNGANEKNCQAKGVVDQTKRLIPSAKIVFAGEVGAGSPSCGFKFDLLHKFRPDF